MEGFLSFLSDLILFTAGVGVLLFWIVILVAVAIETYDFFKELRNKSDEVDPSEDEGIY